MLYSITIQQYSLTCVAFDLISILAFATLHCCRFAGTMRFRSHAKLPVPSAHHERHIHVPVAVDSASDLEASADVLLPSNKSALIIVFCGDSSIQHVPSTRFAMVFILNKG